MLPPSMSSVQVIFQLNDKMKVSDDMNTRKLQAPKTTRLHSCKDFKVAEGTTEEFAKVNVVSVGLNAMEKFLKGKGAPLVILEDPSARDEIMVVPRMLPDEQKQVKPRNPWIWEKSCFAGYCLDSDEAEQRCFDFDWSCTKLCTFVRGKTAASTQNLQETLKEYLDPLYWKIMRAHRLLVGRSNGKGKSAFGASLIAFSEFIGGLAKPFFEDACKLSDSDTIFIASNLVPLDALPRFKVRPEKSLARCQFLEAMVRIAHRKYLVPDRCGNIIDAVKALMTLMEPQLDQIIQFRKDFFRDLFTEENDMVFKHYLDKLRSIFQYFQRKHPYPGGSNGRLITYPAWCQLLQEGGVGKFLSRKAWCEAWALSKEFTENELASWRNMQMSFSEFIVSLGAIIRLKEKDNFQPAFFADYLEEFFEENIKELYDKVRAQELAVAGGILQTADAALLPVLYFLRGLFEEADDDGSGTISIREFKLVLAKPERIEEMKKLDLNFNDVGVLFKQLDTDGSGEITLDEMCDGFVKMKLAMRGVERALAYLQRAFEEADVDQSGVLSRQEFLDFFTSSSVEQKLRSLGVDMDDFNDVLGFVDADASGEVTVEELIHGFLLIRDASKSGNRGITFLRKLFLEADKDQNGALNASEWKKALTTKTCQEKLKKLYLKIPDWESLFYELDTDGSGDISWDELETGMRVYWENAQMEQVHALDAKAVKRSNLEKSARAQGRSISSNTAAPNGTTRALASALTKNFGNRADVELDATDKLGQTSLDYMADDLQQVPKEASNLGHEGCENETPPGSGAVAKLRSAAPKRMQRLSANNTASRCPN